jgi:hypothetical protein
MDPEYVEKIASRMDQLERKEISLRQDTAHTKQELDRMQEDISLEIASLRQELLALEVQVNQSVEQVKLVLAKFKSVSKKGDLQKLQAKVDAWAPEQKMSRKQFKELLEEL